jgi:ketosteroid isomerase-like protein
MSEENVNLIRESYEAWNRQEIQWSLERITDDFEFWPLDGFMDLEPVYRGRDGWTRFWGIWRDAWDSISLEVVRLEAVGDRVVALILATGRGAGSGIDVELEIANVFTIKDGLMTKVESMRWDQALEAVGLSE